MVALQLTERRPSAPTRSTSRSATRRRPSPPAPTKPSPRERRSTFGGTATDAVGSSDLPGIAWDFNYALDLQPGRKATAR